MADKNTNSSPVTSISFTPKSPTKTSGLPVANVNPMSGTIMPALNPKIVTDAKPSKPFKAPTGVHWRDLLNAPLKFVEKIGKEVIDEVSPWITPPTPLERNGITILDGEENPYKSPTDTRSTTPYTPYVNNTGYVPNPESPYGKYLKEPLYLPQPLDRGGINVVKTVVGHPEDITHPAYQLGNPVPEGHTRLYRGIDMEEYAIDNNIDLSKLSPEQIKKLALKHVKDTKDYGRWFALDPAAADEFARGSQAPNSTNWGGGGARRDAQVMIYIDVPNKEASEYEVPTTISTTVDPLGKGTNRYITDRDYSVLEGTPDYQGLMYGGSKRKNVTPEDILNLEVEKERLRQKQEQHAGRKTWSEFPQFLLPKDYIGNAKVATNITNEQIQEWNNFLLDKRKSGELSQEDLRNAYSPGYTKAVIEWYDKLNEEPIKYTGMSDEEKRTFDWKKAYGLEHLPKHIDTYDKYLNALKRKNGLVVTDKETGNSTEFTMGGQPIKNQDSSYLRGLRQQVKEGKMYQAN